MVWKSTPHPFYPIHIHHLFHPVPRCSLETVNLDVFSFILPWHKILQINTNLPLSEDFLFHFSFPLNSKNMLRLCSHVIHLSTFTASWYSIVDAPQFMEISFPTSSPGTERCYASFQGKEAANSPTHLWCLRTTTTVLQNNPKSAKVALVSRK